MDDDLDLSALSDRWSDVRASGEAAALAAELRRELADDHVLNGRAVSAVAVRKLRKEVIFRLVEENRWVWVHLTWHAESGPRWPSTEICESWGELVGLLDEADRE